MACANKNQRDRNIKKNKGGRTEVVLSEEQITEIEMLAEYFTIEQIADYFGISVATFYRIKQKDLRVLRAYKKGKAKSIKEVAGKLRALIDQGDVTAIIFYLKTQGGWSTENKNDQGMKVSFEGSTPEAIFNSGFTALKEGHIDFTRMQQIGNLALTKMNIENNGSKEDKIVYRQRSRAEALEFAAKMKEARENLRLINESNTKAN